MEVKVCTKCKEEKSIEEFSWRSQPKNRRHSDCKVCHRKLRRAYYVNSGEIERLRIQRRKKRAEIKKWFREYKKGLKCSRCSENRPATLVFHHRDPSIKETEVGEIFNKTFRKDRIIKEIEKCEVLCANCHMQEHYGSSYQ